MRLQLLALSLIAAIAGGPAFAGDDGCEGKCDGKSKGHDLCRSRAFCPHCGDACYPTVTKGKETKTCWNIDTVPICIPKVRFPWEKSCCDKGCGKDGCTPPKCGRTKYVNVLMKHEYECSTCKYSWDVDSYKNDNGKGDKAPAGAPAAGTPTLADPPVEASLPRSNRRAAPVALERSSAATPPKKSYAEILTSFFK